MKYYIYLNNKPVEVTENKYHEWEVSDLHNYTFEDYMILFDRHYYTIQISYRGLFDDFEEPRPFLLQLTDENLTGNESHKSKTFNESFETYGAVLARKKEIIKKIKGVFEYA